MPPDAGNEDDAYALSSRGGLKLKGGKSKHKSSHKHKRRSRGDEDVEQDGREHRLHRHKRHHHHHDHRSERPDSEERSLSKTPRPDGGEDIAGSTQEPGQGSAEAAREVGDAGSSSGRDSHSRTRNLTRSEAKFQEAKLKRLSQHISKEASLSHKDRVDAFNKHLESLTEHFDMPKVCMVILGTGEAMRGLNMERVRGCTISLGRRFTDINLFWADWTGLILRLGCIVYQSCNLHNECICHIYGEDNFVRDEYLFSKDNRLSREKNSVFFLKKKRGWDAPSFRTKKPRETGYKAA